MRGADDDDVFGDDRTGIQADFSVDEIEDLVVILFQIDDAVLTEA